MRRSFVVPALLRGLLVTLPMLLAACASGPKVRDVPPEAVVPTQEYRIGPGDALNVFVWNRPELSVNVPVRPDGLISTPLVENMQAAGKNPSQLARDMEAVLAEYVRSPKVNIMVTTPVSTFSQVQVVGQVTRPQALPYREGMKVLDVMLTVGGLGEFAAGNRAKVVRNTDGKQTELRVRLVDLLNKGDMRQNLELRPGDVIVVPQALF